MENLFLYIKENNHNYKESLGQNFLINSLLAKQIINLIDHKSKKILEIGPGLGSLTSELIKLPAELTLVEKDLDLQEVLLKMYGNSPNVNLIFDDFINCIVESKIDTIVGNLPYEYIKEIFYKLISMEFNEGIFMISENYKEDFMAQPGEKRYQSISFLMKLFFKFEVMIDNISKDNFYPKSTVDSCVIRIVPNSKFNQLKELRKIFCNFNLTVDEALPNVNIPIILRKKKIIELDLKDYIYIPPMRQVLFNELNIIN